MASIWLGTIRLDSVLKTEKLPTGIAELNTCLADADTYDLLHFVNSRWN
jgi:hypothetical protein